MFNNIFFSTFVDYITNYLTKYLHTIEQFNFDYLN